MEAREQMAKLDRAALGLQPESDVIWTCVVILSEGKDLLFSDTARRGNPQIRHKMLHVEQFPGRDCRRESGKARLGSTAPKIVPRGTISGERERPWRALLQVALLS
jgi:hypothetical protein